MRDPTDEAEEEKGLFGKKLSSKPSWSPQAQGLRNTYSRIPQQLYMSRVTHAGAAKLCSAWPFTCCSVLLWRKASRLEKRRKPKTFRRVNQDGF